MIVSSQARPQLQVLRCTPRGIDKPVQCMLPRLFHCTVLEELYILSSNPYLLSKPAADLFRNTLCNTHGGHTPRLCAAYLASGGVACLSQVLRHLGCLPRASFSNDHEHLDSMPSWLGIFAA